MKKANPTKKINKILIANRGEIAVRIIRTCREMGIKTVAVYSEADVTWPFIQMADEAYSIGPAPALESYLNIEKIIEVALKSGADAIHPGYGFLSEKSEFAKACTDNGIIFIGPTADAIYEMGDKVRARLSAIQSGVPVVPGMTEPARSIEEAKKWALKEGYPVLLKASAGGGGKGMRVVTQEQEMESSFIQAQGEALKSFGSNEVY